MMLLKTSELELNENAGELPQSLRFTLTCLSAS